jgi:ribosomal protein S18 acetylase RimI-like enzyme
LDYFNPMFRIATHQDLSAINRLVNSAYRGASSLQGWTSEAHLLGGIRTSAPQLQQILEDENSALLLHFADQRQLLGCVCLEKQPPATLYVGMLTVDPTQQNRGIGRKLLAAAEDYAREHQFNCVQMSVISVREELIAWYKRRGYRATGETRPFPMHDPNFGVPKQFLEFTILAKELTIR